MTGWCVMPPRHVRCTMGRMRVLLITGDAALPEPLRDLIVRGSTAIEERRAADLTRDAATGDADRVVFWGAAGDPAIVRAARGILAQPAAERGDTLVFVTPDGAGSAPGLSPHELFIWPRDEDRLKMAFMTGA
jgi:hypothetical protein